MQEIVKKKLVLPVALLAIVGISGAAYTLAHSGPTTASAQTPAVQQGTQADQDKETADDNTTSVTKKTVQPNASPTVDTPEQNDTSDVAGQQDNQSDGETQDGN